VIQQSTNTEGRTMTTEEIGRVYVYERQYNALENRPYLHSIFSTREDAEAFQRQDQYTGTVTEYPVLTARKRKEQHRGD
jgi:hypothetical protein